MAVMAPADAESYWSVGFWVDDADAVADRASGLGGSVVVAPSDAFGMRQAVLADPAGAVFSVTTRRRAPHVARANLASYGFLMRRPSSWIASCAC